MSRGDCAYCGAPVEEWQAAAFPIKGWEVERSPGGHHASGGANQIFHREREPGVIAHASCCRLSGIVGQGKLV